MDSCHLFNFLFGTRKATSELRKRFNQHGQDDRSVRKKSASFVDRQHCHQQQQSSLAATTAAARQPQTAETLTGSPLKQIQLKIANLAHSNPLVSSHPDASNAPKASVFSAPSSPEISIENKKQNIYTQSDAGPIVSLDSECHLVNGVYEAHLVKLDNDYQSELFVDENNNINNNSHNTCDFGATTIDQPNRRQTIVENPANRLLELESQEERPDLELANGQVAINLYDNPLSPHGNIINQKSNSRGENDDDKTTAAAAKIVTKTPTRVSKSERVKNLVQTFELPKREAVTTQTITTTSIVSKKQTKPHEPLANNETHPAQSGSPGVNRTATTITKTRHTTPQQKPPQTPPKSNRAKCLNWQLCLNRPTKISSLFQDESFLTRHFFEKLEPLDRCSAAQVCRTWRRTLYANKLYWKDLIGVIDCTQLRREHLVECILNTLQSAKLKAGHQRAAPTSLASNTTIQDNHAHHHQQQHHNYHLLNNQQQQLATSALDASAFIHTLGQLDQDEIWRIQELCNRFTTRGGFGVTGNAHSAATANRTSVISTTGQHPVDQQALGEAEKTTTATTTTSGIANSKSSSSQISSSTLSSISISSLLSPLSESSRVDFIREKLYTALDERGFDSICLFGATDDDIEDLVSKTRPNGAQAHIRLGRLSNCSISDRGLEMFVGTFGQIEELELTGCNEITNGIDLRGLECLRRLIVTDCINIADGFAQRLAEVITRLEVLVIQAYHLTDAFLEYLSLNSTGGESLLRLKRLELPNCKEITNNSALTIAKHFAHLETLSLSGSCKINDDGAEILAEHMKLVRTLDLGWMRMSDFALECLACDLRDLRELILDRNPAITDIGIGYLATMANLSLLYVRWCPQLTDGSLRALASMRSLRRLSLAGLHQVTARGLASLVDSPNRLIELELTNCPAVTNDLLQFLSARMPHCNIIY